MEVIGGGSIPTNFWDGIKAVKDKLRVNLGLFLCASLCWGLWLVVYKAISLMHRWKVLLPKERDREALNMLLVKLKAKIESLRPMNVLPYNISVSVLLLLGLRSLSRLDVFLGRAYLVMFGFLPKAG
uniref:Uncharacterized protein n=1 Tax=Oryza nivara TaxID=4536 RepID=A0A0E0FIF6_ORYNI